MRADWQVPAAPSRHAEEDDNNDDAIEEDEEDKVRHDWCFA